MGTATTKPEGTARVSEATTVPTYLRRYAAEIDAWRREAFAARAARAARQVGGGTR
jgi:hypothetical protein